MSRQFSLGLRISQLGCAAYSFQSQYLPQGICQFNTFFCCVSIPYSFSLLGLSLLPSPGTWRPACEHPVCRTLYAGSPMFKTKAKPTSRVPSFDPLAFLLQPFPNTLQSQGDPSSNRQHFLLCPPPPSYPGPISPSWESSDLQKEHPLFQNMNLSKAGRKSSSPVC